jgi:hypothetical protein
MLGHAHTAYAHFRQPKFLFEEKKNTNIHTYILVTKEEENAKNTSLVASAGT